MADLDPGLQLFMVQADAEQAPVLPQGLPRTSAQSAPRPERVPIRQLRDFSAHADDLPRQRWSLVVPEGALGDQLVEAVRPLYNRRKQQQQLPPEQQGQQDPQAVANPDPVIMRVPAGSTMSINDAVAWRDRELLQLHLPAKERRREAQIPRYFLILGDLHQVPDTLRWVLQTEGFPGRLAFTKPGGEPDLDRYAAYANKVVRWEDKPAAATQAPCQFFVVRDGSMATEAGLASLVQPTMSIVADERKYNEFPPCQFQPAGDVSILKRANFLSFAQKTEAGVMFSVSHGMGAPRDGWPSPEQQRAMQGAMSFGRTPDGKLTAADLPAGAFLPGGIWFMFACFGAGTPADSVFAHWLSTLQSAGQFGGNVAAVLSSLPKPDQPPFVAALPQALLGNPDGPLAFIGHLDLAWTYGFQDRHTGTERDQPGRFLSVVRSLLGRHRVGVALHELLRAQGAAESELTMQYDAAARDKTTPTMARLGHLFMVRQDLMGYALLGDPAVRLPLSPEPVKRAAVNPLAALGLGMGMGGGSTATAAAQSPQPSLAALEQAFGHLLAGTKSSADAAAAAGIDEKELTRLFGQYQRGGRSAIGRS